MKTAGFVGTGQSVHSRDFRGAHAYRTQSDKVSTIKQSRGEEMRTKEKETGQEESSSGSLTLTHPNIFPCYMYYVPEYTYINYIQFQ